VAAGAHSISAALTTIAAAAPAFACSSPSSLANATALICEPA
jgi:hypothetical protein